MYKSFLQRTAEQLYKQAGVSISNYAIVFPNKRPENYFYQALSQCIAKPIAPPKVYSIEEFITSFTSAQVEDPLRLLLRIFNIYKKYVPDEEFENFIGWGNLMLKDFDEIDRYLVDAAHLFSNLSAIKAIEKDFMPLEMGDLYDFEIEGGAENYLQKRFIKLLDIYSKSYRELKEELQADDLAYTGMCYREVANKILQNDIELPYKKYVFVGFNALAKSEEVIIQKLLDDGKALIFWDADQYYLNNIREDAGHFIRKAMDALNGFNGQTFDERLGFEGKEIHIIGAPQKVGQAKVLGTELKKYYQETQNENTAIILPDENMLLPVLNVLPVEAPKPNITAGYPLQQASLFTLFENIISLHENFRYEMAAFYYKDIKAILSHPYIRELEPEKAKEMLSLMQSDNLIYMNYHLFRGDNEENIIRQIFSPIEKNNDILQYFNLVFLSLKNKIKISTAEEKDIFSYFGELLEYLQELLTKKGLSLSRSALLRLFREKVIQSRIPIGREQASMLQIMGTLESRCLNFDTVFFLSVNEGVFPGSKKNHSYIPYDLRKAYGLPSVDEQEALYAYYFYRLVQGAKRIYLIYNSETGSKGEEKSRFIRQIEYYLKRENQNLKLFRRFYSLPLRNREAIPIVINKDEKYFEALKAKASEKGFSPSFVSSYHICSLQFMLNQVLRLRPQEEMVEDMEANQFGTYFHKLMEIIYQERLGLEVDAAYIKSKKDMLGSLSSHAIEIFHKGQSSHIIQRNSLMVESLKALAEKVLEEDLDHAPFVYLASEHFAQSTLATDHPVFGSIVLQGTIDRIDEKDGIVRIIDYKTGFVKKDKFLYHDAEEKLSYENKEAFQTLFYTYLYYKSTGHENLEAYIIPLKKVAEGYLRVNSQQGKIQISDFEVFELKLKEIILEILDENSPISQTDDLNICSFCNYTHLCLR